MQPSDYIFFALLRLLLLHKRHARRVIFRFRLMRREAARKFVNKQIEKLWTTEQPSKRGGPAREVVRQKMGEARSLPKGENELGWRGRGAGY